MSSGHAESGQRHLPEPPSVAFLAARALIFPICGEHTGTTESRAAGRLCQVLVPRQRASLQAIVALHAPDAGAVVSLVGKAVQRL